MKSEEFLMPPQDGIQNSQYIKCGAAMTHGIGNIVFKSVLNSLVCAELGSVSCSSRVAACICQGSGDGLCICSVGSSLSRGTCLFLRCSQRGATSSYHFSISYLLFKTHHSFLQPGSVQAHIVLSVRVQSDQARVDTGWGTCPLLYHYTGRNASLEPVRV